jgi:hypothetical protein
MAKSTVHGEREREAVDDVLHRLVTALDGEGYTLDDVYQSFRELDTKNRGVLSTSMCVMSRCGAWF